MREKTEMGEVVGGGDEGVVVCLEEKKKQMGDGVGGGDEDGVWCVDRNAEGRIGWEEVMREELCLLEEKWCEG